MGRTLLSSLRFDRFYQFVESGDSPSCRVFLQNSLIDITLELFIGRFPIEKSLFIIPRRYRFPHISRDCFNPGPIIPVPFSPFSNLSNSLLGRFGVGH